MFEGELVRRLGVYAVFKSIDESDEWILETVTELLNQLGRQLGIASWDSPKGAWGPQASENVAQLHATVDVMENAHSWVKPAYLLWFDGRGKSVQVRIQMSLGSNYVGNRLPNHFVNVSLRELGDDGDVLRDSSAVLGSLVALFDPYYVVVNTIPVWDMEQRSGWEIGSGYVCWFSDDLGEISVVPDGLTARRLGEGTLVEAPPEWDVSRVVESGRALREANGIDQVPH